MDVSILKKKRKKKQPEGNKQDNSILPRFITVHSPGRSRSSHVTGKFVKRVGFVNRITVK